MKSVELWVQKWMQQAKELAKDEKKRINLLVCLGLVGLLLLVLPEWLPQEQEQVETDVQTIGIPSGDYAAQLQERLEKLIARVEGAGAATVMVTFASGEENVYATDRQTSSDGSSSVSHVLIDHEGLIETVQTPQVLGVAVVCEGGDEAAVQNQISELVEALTGVGANHITVAKMAAAQ